MLRAVSARVSFILKRLASWQRDPPDRDMRGTQIRIALTLALVLKTADVAEPQLPGQEEVGIEAAIENGPTGLATERSGTDGKGISVEDDGMVTLGTFQIDRYEYPNRLGALPRVSVTWSEARSLCQAKGKRLCSDREWETACRGPRNELYGYGQEFRSGRCNTAYKTDHGWIRGATTATSGSFGDCTNEFGVFDMIGNVWEWTDATYDPTQDWHVVRGGSWFHSVNLARADVRYGRFLDPEYKLDLVGFRCCRSLDQQR